MRWPVRQRSDSNRCNPQLPIANSIRGRNEREKPAARQSVCPRRLATKRVALHRTIARYADAESRSNQSETRRFRAGCIPHVQTELFRATWRSNPSDRTKQIAPLIVIVGTGGRG